MATVKKIGTDGGPTRDYSSPNTWIAYLDALTFTTDETGVCYNDAEFTVTSVIRFTTAVSNGSYIVLLKCAAGHSFYDHADKLTNELYPHVAHGVLVNCAHSNEIYRTDRDNVHTEGLQWVGRDQYQNGFYLYNSSGTNIRVDKTIMLLEDGTDAGTLIQGRNWKVYDSVFIALKGDGYATHSQYSPNYAYNCDFVNLSSNTHTADTVKGNNKTWFHNCAIFGFDAWGVNAEGDYNVSDITGGPGANDTPSKTFADQFENVTTSLSWAETDVADLRAKAGNDLAVGDTATVTALDILGQTRDSTNPYVGAFELIVSGAAGTFSATGIGSMSATGHRSVPGSFSSTGVGSVSAIGHHGYPGSFSAVGSGSMAATGHRGVPGALSVTGVGSMAATGHKGYPGAFAATGIGSLAAIGHRSIPGTFSATGIGFMSAIGIVPGGADGTFSATGIGSMSATGKAGRKGYFSATGTGSLTAFGLAGRKGSFQAIGSGDLVASGHRGVPALFSAIGIGSMAAVGHRKIPATFSATGQGSMVAIGHRGVLGTFSATGLGYMVAVGQASNILDARRVISLSALFRGTEDLSAVFRGTEPLSAVFKDIENLKGLIQ